MLVNRPPLGGSLPTPTIVIKEGQLKPEVPLAVERDHSDNDSGDRTSLHTVSTGQVDYSEKIRVLEDWLTHRGWKMKWYSSGDYTDSACLDDRTVTVTRRQIPRHRYYSLLHECAHVDLLGGPVETRSGEPHGYLDLWYGEVNERTLRHRVAVVIDEIATWQHALELAAKLGLSVDTKLYRKFRDRNLKSYFEWAIDPKAERIP